MNDDTYTEERRAWVREQHAPGHRLEPSAEQHILTRKRYTNSANTDIRKTFARVRRQMVAA
jgi:hypothetical protein